VVHLNTKIIHGNIFSSECQTLVNTVNCEGVMGAGIALEFKLRLPEMFEQYVAHCANGRIEIGKSWVYRPPPSSYERRWVLNFPTKFRWKNPSKVEYLEVGLANFVATYEDQGITSAAFPLLGATHGRLGENVVSRLMIDRLDACDIPIEIYSYDPTASDDRFYQLKTALASQTDAELADGMGLSISDVARIRDEIKNNPAVRSIMRLSSIKGIGQRTIKKLFHYTAASRDVAELQLQLV